MSLADAVAFAVAHWNLDEASGTRNDSVGSSDLSDPNTVGVVAGMFGNAADFEAGSSHYLMSMDNAALSGGNIDFMWRVWAKFESFSGDRDLLGKGGENDLEYDLLVDASGTLSFRVSSGSGFANLTSVSWGEDLSTGVWYLIHAWHDAANNQLGIAVNAGTAVTTSYSAGSYDSASDFRLGSFPFYGNFFDGILDDPVLLKSYLLDAGERTADYDGGTGVAFEDWDEVGGGFVDLAGVSLAGGMQTLSGGIA